MELIKATTNNIAQLQAICLSKEIANTQKSASRLTDFILSPKRLEYYEKYEEFYLIIGRLWRDEDNLITSLKSTIQSLK